MLRNLFAGILIATTISGSVTSASGDTTEVVSGGLYGGGWGHTGNKTISGDGRFVAFNSYSSLVDQDTNGNIDIYVKDRFTGSYVRVSVGTQGEQGLNGSVGHCWINSTGRFVAFASSYGNLVPNDSGGSDIFLRDRDADEDGIFDESDPGATLTELISVDSSEVQSFGDTSYPSVSDDGRYVAFQVTGGNIYMRDRKNGTTEKVNLKSNGQSAMSAWGPVISGDGRHVAWYTYTALESADTNGTGDVYVRSLLLGKTARVNVNYNGGTLIQGNGESKNLNISRDGRYVTFYSVATNLDMEQPDTNGIADAFISDRDADENGIFDEFDGVRTVRVSVATNGTQANGNGVSGISLSDNGRFVAFASNATNLAGDKINSVNDSYLRDRDADADGIYDEIGGVSTTLVSRGGDGSASNDESHSTQMTTDGSVVGFMSYASNLVPGVSGGNAYVRVRTGVEITLAQFDYLNDTLFVEATSPNGSNDQLVLMSYGAMAWNGTSGRWEIVVEGIQIAPTTLTVSGNSGSATTQ